MSETLIRCTTGSILPETDVIGVASQFILGNGAGHWRPRI
jgi:hypothetical protein